MYSGCADECPLFSVIVPAFQCAETLEDCVESVLGQEGSDVELVLVDDGSTDGTGAICDRCASRYPGRVVVIHKDNEGPLAARIDGVLAARGRYLLFLDADDRFVPGALARVREAIEGARVDLVIFNHYRCADAQRRLCAPLYEDGRVFEGPSLSVLRSDALLGPNLNALWQKCVRRDLLENVEAFRSYGRMVMGEDKLLSLSVLGRARRAVYLAEGLYEYRVSEYSLSHDLSLRHYQDMERVYAMCERLLSAWGLDDRESRLARSRVELGLSCLYSIAGRPERPSEAEEFKRAARYLSQDPRFMEAYAEAGDGLSLRGRVAVWLLLHGRGGFLWLMLRCYVRAKERLSAPTRALVSRCA